VLKKINTLIIVSCSFIFSQQLLAEEEGREFAGINFGIGISLTTDLGSNDRIGDVSLDENGIVRIEEKKNELGAVLSITTWNR